MLMYISIGFVLLKERKPFWKVDNENDESYSFHKPSTKRAIIKLHAVKYLMVTDQLNVNQHSSSSSPVIQGLFTVFQLLNGTGKKPFLYY